MLPVDLALGKSDAGLPERREDGVVPDGWMGLDIRPRSAAARRRDRARRHRLLERPDGRLRARAVRRRHARGSRCRREGARRHRGRRRRLGRGDRPGATSPTGSTTCRPAAARARAARGRSYPAWRPWMTPDHNPEVPRRPAIVANWKLGHARAVEGLLRPAARAAAGREHVVRPPSASARRSRAWTSPSMSSRAAASPSTRRTCTRPRPEPSPARCRLRC